MKKECETVFRTLSACGWAIALLATSPVVIAQGSAPSGPAIASQAEGTLTTAQSSVDPSQNDAMDPEEPAYAPLQVGDATQDLLAWQRSGDIASKTPRPIAGNVAQRSYERYLKSFDFPIPERMSSTVKTSAESGGGNTK